MSAVLLLLYILADLALRRVALNGIGVIPWYPGAGLALAFLVLAGSRWAPALFVARLVLYAWPRQGQPVVLPAAAVVEAAFQVGSYAAVAELIRLHVVDGLTSWRMRHAVWLIAASVLAATVAGVISAVQLEWTRGLAPWEFVRAVVVFAVGDAAGALVVLPGLLRARGPVGGRPPAAGGPGGRPAPLAPVRVGLLALLRRWPAERWGEIAAVTVVLALNGWVLAQGGPGLHYMKVLCLLPLAWVAVREGIEGAALVLAAYGLGCIGFVVWGTVTASEGPELQSTLLTLGVAGLLLGAARTESAERSARYWHLLATAAEGVWRVDDAGRTLYLNERMARILGRSTEEVMDQPVREFIAPEDRAHWDGERRARARGLDTVYEAVLLGMGGRRIRALVRESVVRSTAGIPMGSVALVTDVTDLRRAEAEGRRAQLLLEAMFRSSRDAMILFRAGDEVIVDVNDVWCQITGYDREEAIGRSQKDLRVWGDPADSARLAEAIREHGAVNSFEIAYNRHHPGAAPERGYALLSAVPAEVEGETYVFVTARDISAERRREDAERQTRRLEELGRLAGSVSHDFNNLLTVIVAYAELAKMSIAEGEPVAGADLDEIETAAARGQELTRRLLAFSRSQPIHPQVIDLGEVVERAHGMLRSVLGSAQLEMERTDKPLPILADPGQVDQVLINLAINARDAMPDGGRMIVTTHRLYAGPGEVADIVGPDALPGDYAVLRVRDAGSGMDKATQARIFEPFFTTKDPGKGTGLGLAVVFGIVRQGRGGIRVDSAPGEGSTFTIFWPVASMAPVLAPVASPREAEERSFAVNARVLVVEDELTVLRIVRRVLEDARYEVHTAENGLRAMECLEELGDTGSLPDVVLSDVLMPGMGGRELARQLAERWPTLPVILMSGYMGTDDAREGLPNVVVPVIMKPFEVAKLLATVAGVVARVRGARGAGVRSSD